MSIVGGIIIAVAALAGTAISAGVSSAENDRNREEARRLAEIQRQDTLRQRAANNRLATQQLDLGQEKIDDQRQKFLYDRKDQWQKKEDMQQDFVEQSRTGLAQSMKQDRSYLFPNKQNLWGM